MPHKETTDTTGILFVGHGTRNRIGQKQFLDLAQAVSGKLPHLRLEPAFLELAEPSIEDALATLATQTEQILTVPLLLFSAGHAKEDIPSAVAQACEKHSLRCVGQTEPLQHLPPLLQLASHRYRQSLTATDLQIPVERRALLMLGRGSSDLQATRAMRSLTLLRRNTDPVRYAGTAFFAVAKPNPKQLFEYLTRKRNEELIVVQPHLLFDGMLWQEAAEMVQDYQGQTPQRTWRITPPLGADLALAEAISEIITTRLQTLHSLS